MSPVDDPADLPAAPEELREAEALAKALEGAPDSGAPADALEAAALLRAAPLDPVASAAIRARAMPPFRARRFPIRAFAGSLAVIIIVLGAVTAVKQKRPAAAPLPPPPPSLLAAQARAPREGLEPLAKEMAPYRGEVMVALARRYGARR